MSYRSARRDPNADKTQVEKTPAEKYGGGLCKYAWRGNVKRMERCIRKGASIEYEHPISGARPLHRAVLGGKPEAIEFLLGKGARVDAMDNEEWQPLHFAASKGFTKIARRLIERGAPVDAQDVNGNTAMHLACQKNNPGVVCVLVESGADQEISNVEGHTCRDVVASGSHVLAALDGDIELINEDMQVECGSSDDDERDSALDAEVVKGRALYGIVLDD